MHGKTREIYEVLKTVAARHQLITYGELGQRVGIHPRALRTYLERIFEHEHRAGRPPITALVVYTTPQPRNPSYGFYRVARQLGLLADDGDEEAFWARTCDEVYAYYSREQG